MSLRDDAYVCEFSGGCVDVSSLEEDCLWWISALTIYIPAGALQPEVCLDLCIDINDDVKCSHRPGQYHWISELAPPQFQKGLSYSVGRCHPYIDFESLY